MPFLSHSTPLHRLSVSVRPEGAASYTSVPSPFTVPESCEALATTVWPAPFAVMYCAAMLLPASVRVLPSATLNVMP